MAPTLTVRQVVTPNVVDDVNFARVMKMDRCTTCHLAIDRARLREVSAAVHARTRTCPAYVGSDSPHPLATTGCTVCHQGLGGSTSFNDASHYPSNAKQRQEWEEKYHWHEPHMWDYPMLPTNMTEASCVQCHRQEIYVPNAPKLAVAYATFERAGCYACHKTKGFENLRKPGPILTKISGKLTQDWVKNWVRDPCADQERHLDAEGLVQLEQQRAGRPSAQRSGDQRGGRLSVRQQRAPTRPPSRRRRAATRKAGEQIVRSIGCLGCHIIDENDRAAVGPRRTFGQPLKSVGSKTTYAWLYNWVRDPKHYNPGTYMPDLRLTDPQVADVATYLTTLTGPAGTAGAGDADAGADRRGAARLPPQPDAAGRGAGAPGEDGHERQAARPRAARHRAVRLLQLPRHQRVRDDAADRRRPVGRGQQARHAPRLCVRRHRAFEARLVPSEAEGSALVRSGPRAGAAREAADARLPLQRGRERAAADGHHELPARRAAGVGAAAADGEARLHRARARARAPAELRRLSRDRRGWRRLSNGRERSDARAADADARRRQGAARLAVCVPAGADHDSAVAERAHADLRSRRRALERHHRLLRGDGKLDRVVPDLQPRRADEHGRPGTRAVRPAEVPAVPRARRDSGRSAAVEPGARSAHDARAAEAGVDSRLAAESRPDSARHAHAAVLADAAVSEVGVPAARRRCRGADSGDSGSLDDAQRRPESAAAQRRRRVRTDRA